MEEKRSFNNISKKILAVMREVHKVGKDAVNTFQKYNYTSAEAIIRAVRESMARHGLVIGPVRHIDIQYEKEPSPKGGVNYLYTIVQEYSIIDTDSGEVMFYQIPAQGSDKGDKAVYKAHTGGFKYFLRTAFAIEMTDDPEKDSPGFENEPQQPAKQQPQTQQPRRGRPPAKKPDEQTQNDKEKQRQVGIKKIEKLKADLDKLGCDWSEEELLAYDTRGQKSLKDLIILFTNFGAKYKDITATPEDKK